MLSCTVLLSQVGLWILVTLTSSHYQPIFSTQRDSQVPPGFPLFTPAWKTSPSNKPGQSEGSSLLFPFFQGPLSWAAWCSMSENCCVINFVCFLNFISEDQPNTCVPYCPEGAIAQWGFNLFFSYDVWNWESSIICKGHLNLFYFPISSCSLLFTPIELLVFFLLHV